MDATFSDDLHDWKIATRFKHGMRYHDLPRGTQCWKPVEKLGEGTCGEVWKEQCLSGTSSSSSIFRAVKREIKALTTFSDDRVVEYQQHFVQIRGWFEDESHWYIAMELAEHGNLQQHIDQGCIPEPEAASITAQIARALLHMHTRSLVHRDLKPLVVSKNILVSQRGPTWHVKVADFGITRDLSDTVAGTHQIGTFGYMAPELWHTSERYTSAVDVWALGAIAFCMRTGSPPFPNPLTLANYPEDPTVFPTLKLRSSTQPCRGFITGAMAAIPQERLTIIEAVGHYWLSRDMNV
ncbi:kinase-like protein [Neurospora crassa]|nr:kinase-like protein [Neurospora crassa]